MAEKLDIIKDSIQNNLSEWDNLINELSSKEVKLFNKKETYNALSEEIIQSTDLNHYMVRIMKVFVKHMLKKH